jgi:hypothetical protein
MIQYNFIPQKVKGKPKIRGVGSFYYDDKTREAIFYDLNETELGHLKRARILWIHSGIFLDGVESRGMDQDGKEKFTYQEWYLSFKET